MRFLCIRGNAVCAEAIGHISQSALPAVTMSEFPSQWPHLCPSPCPPSLPRPLLWWSGLCSAISESQQSPGPTCPGPRHPNASRCGTGCWSLPYNTAFSEDLHKCDQGQFAFVGILGKEVSKTLSNFSIIGQQKQSEVAYLFDRDLKA